MAEALTISGLEQKTGVSRSTIHFYIREGLLPQPQKTAASRALYGDVHVRLLRRIVEMKRAGRSLPEIRAALAKELAKARESSVDLAGQENERIRAAILRVATQEFMAKGYKRTHVANIIRGLGITPQVFYSHFPSKRQLLVESFNTFIRWNLAFFEPQLTKSSDLGEKLLWRVLADVRANEFGSEVLSLVRSEETEGTDLARSVESAWEGVISLMVEDFESVRPVGAAASPISFELLAYSMIGALHNTALRVSWDEKYDRADILRLHLWTWLALLAAISGEVDVDSRLARYEGLIQEMAAREPQTPPALPD
ncbi:MAG: MerR family transcriptional regulator [Thermoleophilia bacterium]|nr:MerR family transcriptional regulator [Thermoleophilia bacterium]